MVITRGQNVGETRLMFKGTNLQQVLNKPQSSNEQCNDYMQLYGTICSVIDKCCYNSNHVTKYTYQSKKIKK